MSHFNLKTIGPIFLLVILTSCGSLTEWKREIAQTPSIFDTVPSTPQYSAEQVQQPAPQRRPAWNPHALRVTSGALSAAQDRWPWAQGYQLQRIAQILQLGPDYSALRNLDTSSDTAGEIQILRELLEKRQQFASSAY